MQQRSPAPVGAAPGAGWLCSAHAQLSTSAALHLAGRLAPRRTVELYAAAFCVPPAQLPWLRQQAARGGADTRHERLAPQSVSGLLRFRDWLKVREAPRGDSGLEAELAAEFDRCRRALVVAAARQAARAALTADASHRAAVLNAALHRIGVPASLRGAVHAEAVRRVVTVVRIADPRPALPLWRALHGPALPAISSRSDSAPSATRAASRGPSRPRHAAHRAG